MIARRVRVFGPQGWETENINYEDVVNSRWLTPKEKNLVLGDYVEPTRVRFGRRSKPAKLRVNAKLPHTVRRNGFKYEKLYSETCNLELEKGFAVYYNKFLDDYIDVAICNGRIVEEQYINNKYLY